MAGYTPPAASLKVTPVLRAVLLAWVLSPAAAGAQTEAGECGDEVFSDPVGSYRISGECRISDIEPVGPYRYGFDRVAAEIRDFERRDTERRLSDGNIRLVTRVTIELHKALEMPATLECLTDMMGREVIEARIIYRKDDPRVLGAAAMEDLAIRAGRLPELGVFTHSITVGHTPNECPPKPTRPRAPLIPEYVS